ncbi:MAG: hypothetical protein LBF61_11585 [Azoarcus sp.]|jgi:hypothetical protein|nr:hypothetical protein [Azoarcus sp.]
MKNRHMRETGLFRNVLRAIALAAVLCGGSVTAMAQRAGGDVPDALKPWKAWVLHGQEAKLCPEVAGLRKAGFCAWPGELKLEMREGGIQFSQIWEMRREGVAPLPGSREYWPRQVTVDGWPHPVLTRGSDGSDDDADKADDIPSDAPVVWLTAGRHAVNGWIPWLERPRELPVPKSVALISLFVDGKAVLPLERGETALMLSGAGETAREQAREDDSLDIQVYRKLSDGIPARLTTRVRLKVSGKPRELSVADILPERFVPVSIVSPWAARLDQDGRLRVQALPGQVTVEIAARLDGPLGEISPGLSPQRPQEVWSYEAAPALRTTTILPDESGGALAVDPRQAGVPEDWLPLPALAVSEGARLRVEEHSRGQDERENQRLRLQREMWLDFSGKGFFARDRIEGSMRQGWRFDMARPWTLVRADNSVISTSGAKDLAAALLVTQGADESLRGVEWRWPQVMLNAGARLEAGASARMPVTGWRQTFDSVHSTLHLPYGYRLIAAPGVDKASANVWVEHWTMLEIFLAAFFTLLSWRLFGTKGGIAAAAYLILAMPEPTAPVQSFVAVVVFVLLYQLVPEGRLRVIFRIGQYLALFWLVVTAVNFIPAQIRYALYPQLEEKGFVSIGVAPRAAPQGIAVLDEEGEAASADVVAEPQQPAAQQDMPRAASIARKLSLPAPAPANEYARQRYAQSSVTQTGSGEPAWELGEQYNLHWAGPVTAAQSVRLLVSPPWLTRFSRVVTITLLGVLAWLLVNAVFPGTTAPSAWLEKLRAALPSGFPRRASKKAASWAGVALAVSFAAAMSLSSPAAAESMSGFPSGELLDELRTRLLEAPACSPACVDVPEARIEAEPHVLRVTLSAHAAAAATLPLPEPGGHLGLRGVRVDGVAHSVLRFNGRNYLALQPGVRRVQIEYTPNGDAVSLSFPLLPARVEFAGTGWQAEGIDESRLLNETLNLSRSVSGPVLSGESGEYPADRVAQTQQFSPFVHVRRDIALDLDWSVDTEVRRVAPVEGGFTVPVPLIAGEHVTTPSVKVQDGRALAVFLGNAVRASWSARLDDEAKTLELLAPPLSERSETWRVTVNPSWHLEWNGVPVTLAGDGEGQAVFEFHPLPGEKLTLTVFRPATVEGSFLAIDRVDLYSKIGRHASDYTLVFLLRASRGGEHHIGLPPYLEMIEARRNGLPLNLQVRENRLSLPVSPGMQTYVLRLRGQEGAGLITGSPAIDLGLPAANITLQAALGEQRWVLATGGPDVGPAVLYWGELLAALIVAFLLARSRWSSLRLWEWFLLVLGFSTFSWTTLLFIALWLVVINWRTRADACADWPARKFNAMQAGIVVLTVVMLEELIAAVPKGLLSVPGMGIRGHDSSAGQLNWFADQGGPLLPVGWIFSLPVWVYRLFMLAWALWLAYILIRWLGRGFAAWLRHGYWKKTGGKAPAEKETLSGAAGKDARAGEGNIEKRP